MEGFVVDLMKFCAYWSVICMKSIDTKLLHILQEEMVEQQVRDMLSYISYRIAKSLP